MDKYEDATLRKVLAVTLDPAGAQPQTNPPVIYLGQLAQELQAESGTSDTPLLSGSNLERVLMARLSDPPAAYPQWPVHYLIGCYARAAEELRSVSHLKSPQDQARLSEALGLARQLAVSYVGLTLYMDMFPQPPQAQQRGALQLLDSIEKASTSAASGTAGLAGGYVPGAEGGGSGTAGGTSSGGGGGGGLPGGPVPAPPGFLEDFGARFEEEGLQEVVEAMAVSLMARLSRLSPLADTGTPLALLDRLARCKPFARALTRSPRWLPAQQESGRTLEFNSILGPAFGISALPDPTQYLPLRQPDVGAQCFSDADSRPPTDLHQSFVALQASSGQLRRSLHGIVMAFLQNKDTRDAMLNWLAGALQSNAEREKMQPDPRRMANDGFMLNLAGVMLLLCEPFVDPIAGKAWPRLDARYVSDPASRDPHRPEELTRLAADSDAVRRWAGWGAGGAGAVGANGAGGSGAPYHFICECFFMGAHALHLGLAKAHDMHHKLARAVPHYTEELQQKEAELSSDPMNPELRRDVMQLRATLPRLKMRVCCLEALLQDKQLLAEALAFYRLLAAYLVRLASPASARGLPPSLPLPSPAPMEFAQLPEYYVEDLCELVIWVGRVRPDLIEPRKMEELMSFFTVFLGSPDYIKNPYLRGKMVEALHSYMPAPEEGAGAASWRRGRNGRGRSSAAEVAMLFEVHPLVIQNMVRSLITIYIDIEFTDRHNVFNEKFGTRYQIGDVLAYLWNLPQHRASWQAVAREQPKLYVRFINMLINDSQHLLQEGLETLPRVQGTERLMANPAAFAALSPEEQADAQSGLATNERILRADFQLASVCIKTMQYTSEDRVVAALFFEAEVRDRMARNLDFFLKYLTVPEERKRLRVRDPEKYSWHPKELISQLARIHLNLYRTNPGQWAEAVVADENYYGTTPQMFPELLGVLRTLGLADAQDVADLERMVAQVEQTKAATAAEEEAFGEIPDEFEDPLLGGIMRDPVKLPSGNIVDRRTIVQQLLNDPRDPFNRQPMSEVDLLPQPELAQRIRDWVAQQRAASQMQE